MEDTPYNDKEFYDGSYLLEVPFPIMLAKSGKVLVGHVAKCLNCNLSGDLYINMSLVKDDIVSEPCPFCYTGKVKLITYDNV